MDLTQHMKSCSFQQQNDIGIYCCGKRIRTKNYKEGPVVHSRYLFAIIKEGNAIMHSCNDLPFGQNDLFIIFPNTPIHYSTLTDWSIDWVGLYGKTVDDIVRHLGVTPKNPIVKLNRFDEVSNILEKIYILSSKPQSLEIDFEMAKLTYAFFQYLVSDVKVTAKEDPVAAAMEIIDLNYTAPIKIAEIAKQFHLHPVYLEKLFRKQVGVSMKRYLINKRLDYAKELLKNTALNLSEISNFVGCTDSLYFSKIFKNRYGMSPTEYRKTIQK